MNRDSEIDKGAPIPMEDPGIRSVYEYLTYGLSLPERTLRSTSAMVGGILRESSELLVPQAFRSSKSYEIFVQQALDLMTENIGGVEAEEQKGPSTTQVEGYVARKAIGNFVELAGFATLHVSPITVLAILSDIAYGSTSYLKELSIELKKEGVIAADSTIDSATDLLDAISDASGVTAQAFDLPPISVDGLRETIEQTRAAVARVDATRLMPQGEIARLWKEMNDVAAREQVGLFEVSSAMALFSLNRVTTVGKGALSTIRVAGNLFDKHILDHYVDGIDDIRQRGIYSSLSESSRPYLAAVWQNFSTDKPTFTEDLFSGRLFGRAWAGMSGWFVPEPQPSATDLVASQGEPQGEKDAELPTGQALDEQDDAQGDQAQGDQAQGDKA